MRATLPVPIEIRFNAPVASSSFKAILNSQDVMPGTATLCIKAIVAPDNVGTFEVSLGDGLTFQDGSTSRSGTLPQGGSTAFAITIPEP